jgi:hypothetical protein
MEYEVEALADRRERSGGRVEFLVKWGGYGEEENTWEPREKLPGGMVAAFEAVRGAGSSAKRKASGSVSEAKGSKKPKRARAKEEARMGEEARIGDEARMGGEARILKEEGRAREEAEVAGTFGAGVAMDGDGVVVRGIFLVGVLVAVLVTVLLEVLVLCTVLVVNARS